MLGSIELFLSRANSKTGIYYTREMQGIEGQASDFVEVVSTLKDRLNSPARDLMKKDRKIKTWQKWLTSSVVVRFFNFFAWTHQPTHEFDCRTSSGCRCLWGTHVGGHARTRYRVGPGLRLPMRKKENVEERLKEIYSRLQLAPS